MTLFVITFFSIYGGMHLYAFLRARAALGFGPVVGTVVALFMVAMTVVPFLIRGLERVEYELSARVLSYVGYIWLAAVFLFFISSLVFDLYNLIVSGGALLGSDRFAKLRIAPHLSFFISFGLASVICLYGYFE